MLELFFIFETRVKGGWEQRWNSGSTEHMLTVLSVYKPLPLPPFHIAAFPAAPALQFSSSGLEEKVDLSARQPIAVQQSARDEQEGRSLSFAAENHWAERKKGAKARYAVIPPQSLCVIEV